MPEEAHVRNGVRSSPALAAHHDLVLVCPSHDSGRLLSFGLALLFRSGWLLVYRGFEDICLRGHPYPIRRGGSTGILVYAARRSDNPGC